MDKQYFFLNGVPRAGNTLLATILNQNPDMQVSANSLVTGGLLHQAHSLTSSELFKNFPDNKSLDNVLENIIPNYYKDWNCKYIIDRSQVGIQDILLLLKKYLKNPLKIIVLERPLEDIISSFMTAQKNWKSPLDNQLEWLLRPDGALMVGLMSIKNLSRPEYKNITHFITYDDLVNNPKKIINGIYEFLEVPQYNHYFNNLKKFSVNGMFYNENWLLPTQVEMDLHDVKTKDISFTKHDKLPEYALNKLQNFFGHEEWNKTNGRGH
mgnify:CR=1 FL=1